MATKLFISQPMKDRSKQDIIEERKFLIRKANEMFGDDVEILDSYFPDYDGNALGFLSKSIEVLSKADVALFGKGWENARGCKIEHTCAVEYGIKVITA